MLACSLHRDVFLKSSVLFALSCWNYYSSTNNMNFDSEFRKHVVFMKFLRHHILVWFERRKMILSSSVGFPFYFSFFFFL